MTDRERTIKWLECCGGYNNELEHIGCTAECPYWESENCCNSSKPFQDAIALLKEQEPVEPSIDVDTYVCPNCGHRLEHQGMLGDNMIFDERYNFCPACGKAVKWNG